MCTRKKPKEPQVIPHKDAPAHKGMRVVVLCHGLDVLRIYDFIHNIFIIIKQKFTKHFINTERAQEDVAYFAIDVH